MGLHHKPPPVVKAKNVVRVRESLKTKLTDKNAIRPPFREPPCRGPHSFSGTPVGSHNAKFTHSESFGFTRILAGEEIVDVKSYVTRRKLGIKLVAFEFTFRH